MNRFKALGGLFAIAVVSVGVFAAPAAVAASKGTTAFTCVQSGPGGTFTKAHCAAADAGAGEYKEVGMAENTVFYVSGINHETSKTNVSWKLKSNVGGAALEIEINEAVLNGSVFNTKNATTGEHTAIGAAVFSFWGVTVTKPAKEGCVVKLDEQPGEGQVEHFLSEVLLWGSPGQGDALRFEPEKGTVLATFYVAGCKIAKFNGTYSLTGSVKTNSVDGATISFNHAATTTLKTLKLNGAEAGLEGGLTLEAADEKIEGDTTKPLSFTTVATP
jgi:hypothetical protein